MRLIAVDLTGRDPELIADRCWQAGAAGLWEVDASTLRAGVDADLLPSFLAALDDLDPVDVTEVEAVELAGRASVVRFAGQDIDLWIPATVFGDGAHPTTAACLSLLGEAVDRDASVLDVGCGAGALSIGAALLGARVTAVDIDPEAVAATAANAARNGVAIETSLVTVGEVAGRFDVVVANMTTGSLTPLLPDLALATRPGGTLVVSGLLEDQWPPVRTSVGGQVTAVQVVDGWLTAAIRLP